MRRLKWIDWNLDKIDAHGLTKEDVESAFANPSLTRKRRDGWNRTVGRSQSGRMIEIIWRFDRHAEEGPDATGEIAEPPIFVITAYRK